MNNNSLNDDRIQDGTSWNEQESASAVSTVDSLLDRLISEPNEVDAFYFYAFSDLSTGDLQKVREHWSSVPVARRRLIVQQLVESAEEDIDLHLGRFLRVTLDDDDAEVRTCSIEGLWEDEGADLVDRLIPILQHDVATEARIAAANALGRYVFLGELEELDANLAFRAQEALLQILQNVHEPFDLRGAALKSIAFSGEEGVRELIEDAYYASTEEMRLNALVAMGRSADVRWRSYIRAELRNPSAAMRAEAAIAAGELETYAALPDLLELLGDADQKVQLAAIFALGRLGGAEATNALSLLAEDADEEVSAAVETALEEMAFFANLEGVPLFDEEFDPGDEFELDPWDIWNDIDDIDLGSYG